MLNNDLGLLMEPFRSKVVKFLEFINTPDFCNQLGVSRFVVTETKRDLVVQLAYASRLMARYASTEYRVMSLDFVRAAYRIAGLVPPVNDDECLKPVTWTMKSKHLTGNAVDIWPSKDGEDIWWAPFTWEGWKKLADIAVRLEIKPGYYYFKDAPHFEEIDH